MKSLILNDRLKQIEPKSAPNLLILGNWQQLEKSLGDTEKDFGSLSMLNI